MLHIKTTIVIMFVTLNLRSKDGEKLDATERHFFAADNQLLIVVKAKPTDAGRFVNKSIVNFHFSPSDTYVQMSIF